MNKLETSIKVFSSIFTETTETINDVYNNIDTYEINYDNSISLYNLIKAFNKLHKEFIKEYETLDKFDYGKKMVVDSFNKSIDSNGKVSRNLCIFIEDSKITDEDVDLYITEYDGEIHSVITPVAEDYQSGVEITIDNNKAKKYLDLFEKHELLMELYNHLKSNIIFSNGTLSLFTQIGNSKEKFIDNLGSFKVNFGSTFVFDLGDHIRISMKLGEELSIDLDDCKINLEGEMITPTEEMCLEILNKVFINGKYLETPFNDIDIEENKTKIKMLRDNIK